MKVKNFLDPRQRHPQVSMTDAEAQFIMDFEQEANRMLPSKTAVEVALMLMRATDEERDIICEYLS